MLDESRYEFGVDPATGKDHGAEQIHDRETGTTVTMQPLVSSNLAAAGYHEENRELHIRFTNGGVYVYSNVPPAIYDGLIAASSAGRYHAQMIKGNFPFRKLG